MYTLKSDTVALNFTLNFNFLTYFRYLRLACLERDEGQLQKAMKWIEVALAVQPDNHDALTLRGNLHLRRKDFQKVR